MGRLWSGVWVSATFEIFALTAGGMSYISGEGNCPGGEMSRGNVLHSSLVPSVEGHAQFAHIRGGTQINHF